jgi:branched-subunit amino acid aminotransferase/4-amino-4-deoxychorismate lyase
MHDRNAATVALANAQRPIPPVPPSATAAMADAIAAENPNLQAHEAAARANQVLAAATAARGAHRDAAMLDAKAKIAEVDAATQRRTAVTLPA